MVTSFSFSRLPAIFFGPGKIGNLPGLVKKLGSEIILLTDQGSFFSSSQSVQLIDDFGRFGISYTHVVIRGEPSPEIIDNTVSQFREKRVDAVVSIGGGSVIDAGKAVSAMLHKTGSVTEYLEGVGSREHPGTKIPFIALPTTSGTGSEATKNAVISNVGKNGFKRSLRHENLVPDVAIIDPGLTVSCPREVTAASGMDCFTQLVESYLSDKSGALTDALAIDALCKIKTSLFQSYLHGDDIEARSGMAYSALISGICLANAGLGAVHGFASSIGGMYNIPHGIICGTLMASANSANAKKLGKKGGNPEAIRKYIELGKLFIETTGKTDDYYIDGFIGYLNELTAKMQIPKLGQYGIKESDISEIGRQTDIKNNPVELKPEELEEILRERL